MRTDDLYLALGIGGAIAFLITREYLLYRLRRSWRDERAQRTRAAHMAYARIVEYEADSDVYLSELEFESVEWWMREKQAIHVPTLDGNGLRIYGRNVYSRGRTPVA